MAGRSPALIVNPVKRHTATVIFAHGLGDSGAGWMSLATNWRRRGKFDHVKFIFPNAPNIPITVNMGMNMPGWYDIQSVLKHTLTEDFHKGFDDKQEAGQDEEGILGSKQFFDTLVLNEVTQGIPSTRIVLGGFSQGGAVALLAGLTSPRPLAGVVGLSTYLPLGERVAELVRAAEPAPSRDVPFFVAHGARDPLVKLSWSQRSRDAIAALGWHNLEYRVYPDLEHSADPKEIEDLEVWLEARLPDSAP